MTETKVTKAMILDMIIEACADNAVIVEYCENEKTLLANKKAKAQERAYEKKVAGDELRATIQSILENATEPMTREMILAQFENEDGELTVGKIGNRVSQLVQLNLAHSVKVKTEDNKSKVAYVWGAADAE